MSSIVYGETFRRNVSRALAQLDTLSFVTPETKEKLTAQAARLCLVEAVAEQQAHALAQQAAQEWKTHSPKIEAALQRFVTQGAETAKVIGTEFDTLTKQLTRQIFSNASAGRTADSPQTEADASKPEA